MAEHTVLMISYYFPPMGLSGVQRTLKFAKYLPEFGWKPIVLTTTANNYYAYDDSLVEEIKDREVLVCRTKPKPGKTLTYERKVRKFPSYFLQNLGRIFLQSVYLPDSKIKWKKQALSLGERIINNNKVDVIFATAPPFTDFLVAMELSQKFGIPYIIDYRDIWIDNPFHFFPTPMHKSYCEKMERKILNHAKRAVVTTRFSKETLLKRYKFLSHNDIQIITHGYDSEDFDKFATVVPDNQKFTITHSGLFQDDRTPKYFLKALSNFIRKNPDAKVLVEARFLGVMRKSHLKYIKKYNLGNNVVTTGYLSHEEAVRQLKESDVLWLMQHDEVRSPGKLFEYFGARKPIIACLPDSLIRKTALDTKATIAVEPKDVKAIENAIETFFSLWKHKNLPVPKIDYTNKFERRELTSDLARELALSIDL